MKAGKAWAPVALVSALMTVSAFAASLEYQPAAHAAPRPLSATGPSDPEEIEAFLDGVMEMQLASKPAVGATVAVVKDGELIFAKGYGHEDYEKRTPVDPALTLFRPGSVSKLFTWTAVMQLVEEGKLDLDADVNTYLEDFKIPDTFEEPITLRNLMTHTPGLEDGGVGYLFAHSEKDLIPLGESLKKHMPARVRPPTRDFSDGTNASYSNWGTALAGHIVATVAGMPFEQYIEERIFQPLGMTRSTFREPLPAELAERMSGGYVWKHGTFERKEFEFIHNFGPAGALSATATDMARFMIAHLQKGALGDARILKPETAQLMHARALSPDPALAGGCLGFYETYINGRRIIGHGGDTLYFHSELTLVPEANVGFFVSFNTAEAGRAAVEMQDAFVRHYFPAELPVLKAEASAAKENAAYAGSYRVLRHSFTKFEKVFAAGGDLKVQPMPDGSLLFVDLLANKPARWIGAGNGVFRQIDKDVFVAFKGATNGPATHLVGPFAPMAFERIGWYENVTLHAVVLVLFVVLLITITVSAVKRRREARAAPPVLRWARPALALSAWLLLAFLILFAIVVAAGIDQLIFKIPTTLYVALALPLLALIPLAFALYALVAVWRGSAWTRGARIHYTGAAVAVTLLVLVLGYWNLLGWRFG